MVVGNNESTTPKNTGKLLAISIAMAIQLYNVGRIVSRASLEATGYRYWSSACSVLPRR